MAETKEPPPDYEDIAMIPQPPSTYHPDLVFTGTPKPTSETAKLKSVLLVVIVVLGSAVLLGFAGYGIYYAVYEPDDDITTTTPSVTTSGAETTEASTTTVSTTTTTTLPTTTTTTIALTSPAESGWGDWSSWSFCDVTCDDGQQLRNRTCYSDNPSTDCKGRDEDSRSCNDGDCPHPEFGTWGAWSSWFNCSDTCGGGTQVRVRACEKEPGDEECIGKSEDSRDCNTWDCPNCDDRMCPDGGEGVPPDCKQCKCDGKNYIGKVTNINNVPILYVSLRDNYSPLDEIAVTDEDGQFIIEDACDGVEILLTDPAYVDRIVHVDTTSDATIKLQPVEPLKIIKDPQSKARLLGESVTFCCAADGFPQPDYFEWLKDDILANGTQEDNSTGSSLTIESVTIQDAGSYQCRASNDKSAVFSTSAELTIKQTSDDFCNRPSRRLASLPDGCTYEGSTHADIGTCSGILCKSADLETGQCYEKNQHCCAPVQYQMDRMTCVTPGGIQEQPLFFVKECGCRRCPPPAVRIVGRVVNSLTSAPINEIDVYVDGEIVTQTNERGVFSLNLPNERKKVVVKVKDSNRAYMDSTKTILFKPNKVVRKSIRMKLIPLQPGQIIDSTANNFIDIGINRTFAQIIIWNNSFVTMDGDTYNGNVESKVVVIDPLDAFSFENAPGQLITLDSGGQEKLLKTYGMFAMKFFATDTDEELQLKKKVKLLFDSSLIKQNDSIKIWQMKSDMGIWQLQDGIVPEDEGFKRWRRSFSSAVVMEDVDIGDGEISVDDPWVNFDDYVSQVCYSKIRIYYTNSDEGFEDPNQWITGDSRDEYEYRVYVLDGENTYQTSDFQSYDSPDDYYCMLHLCDINEALSENFRGYITVTHGSGARLYAADPSKEVCGLDEDTITELDYSVEENIYLETGAISVRFSKILQPGIGPYYPISYCSGKDWRCSKDCSEIKNPDNDNHFKLYDTDVRSSGLYCQNDFGDRKTMPATPYSNSDEPQVTKLFSWQSFGSETYESCFIKVVATGVNAMVPFTLRSSVSNLTGEYSDGIIRFGDNYGQDGTCSMGEGPETAVCLEFKAPGLVSDGVNTFEEEPVIRVEMGNDTYSSRICKVSDIAPGYDSLPGKITSAIGDPYFEFYTVTGRESASLGIYCSVGVTTSQEDASYAAKNYCAAGSMTGAPQFDEPPETNTDFPAATFHCEL